MCRPVMALPALFDDPGARLRAANWGQITSAYSEFSPEREQRELLDHVGRQMQS